VIAAFLVNEVADRAAFLLAIYFSAFLLALIIAEKVRHKSLKCRYN
jgi:hypothetical protein